MLMSEIMFFLQRGKKMILFVAAKEDDARLLIQMLLLSFAALLKPSAATLLFVCITNLLPYLPSSTLLFNALRALELNFRLVAIRFQLLASNTKSIDTTKTYKEMCPQIFLVSVL